MDGVGEKTTGCGGGGGVTERIDGVTELCSSRGWGSGTGRGEDEDPDIALGSSATVGLGVDAVAWAAVLGVTEPASVTGAGGTFL